MNNQNVVSACAPVPALFRSMAQTLHVNTAEEAKEKIEAFETRTASRFCCVRSDKNFGRIGEYSYHWKLKKLMLLKEFSQVTYSMW